MKTIKKQLVTTLLASTFMAFASTAIATTVNVAANTTHVGDLGNLDVGTTVTIGANSTVTGNVFSASTVTLGANSQILGGVEALTTVTTGADSMVCGNINSVTVTLGANAGAAGNLTATTVTTGANSFVSGDLVAITATLGADACYGSASMGFTTLVLGAGSGGGDGTCPIIIEGCPVVDEDPIVIDPIDEETVHANSHASGDGSDHHFVNGVGIAHTH
jgi:cytoskeletal protein CcmA (bactofilin family)